MKIARKYPEFVIPAEQGVSNTIRDRQRPPPPPEIVIPAKAGIQGWWSGDTPLWHPSTTPGFPLSRE